MGNHQSRWINELGNPDSFRFIRNESGDFSSFFAGAEAVGFWSKKQEIQGIPENRGIGEMGNQKNHKNRWSHEWVPGGSCDQTVDTTMFVGASAQKMIREPRILEKSQKLTKT